jgi:Immune inhibitor A-like, MAM domain/Carboxypeptidase regulatory-like domain/Secretion system C-terminal sorting domain
MKRFCTGGALILLLVCLTTPLALAEQGNVSYAEKQETMNVIQAWENGETLTSYEQDLLRHVGIDPDQPNDPVIDQSGGPDFFGHLWIDSNEPAGPTFSWVDITATGTDIAPELSDDDTEGPFDLGFNFPFYSNAYSQVYVQSNGGLTFGDFYFTYTNRLLPYDMNQDDNSVIAWLWDDWYIANGNQGDVYVGQAVVDQRNAWVVSYIDVDHISIGTINAQCILFEDGEILIQIQSFTPDYNTNSCSIGIQNDDLTDYLQVVYNEAYLEEELAISFYLADPDASISGTVTDIDTGIPVADATVIVGGWTTTTDGNGDYLLETLYGGVTYDVEIRGLNYYIYNSTTLVEIGENTLDAQIEHFPDPYNGTYATDFENNQGLFSWQEGADWEYGTPTFWPVGAYSGENALSTILTGSYNNSRDDWMLMTETFLIEDVESFLTYWHWFNYESEMDGYNVQISLDGMETWEVLEPDGGYNDSNGIFANGNQPCWNNGGVGAGSWTQVTYSLSQYLDQQIWLAFRHTTNEDFNVYSGVTIDDLEVNVGTPPTGLGLELIGQVVTIPPSGGTVIFDAIITSTLPAPMLLDAWTFVTLPNGTTMGPIYNIDVMVPPGTNAQIGLPQAVPPTAPGGTYTYTAYIGLLPQQIGAEASFEFVKIGAAMEGEGTWYDETWETKLNGQVTADASASSMPSEFSLGEVYPNPFNSSTSVVLNLPSDTEVSVVVFNVMGQQVATLADGQLTAGVHTLSFEAESLSSGVYFVKATVPGQLNEIRKVTLLR